jgi:hypothetical protein
MTDPGDKLARRYRELAREEPPASLDASILAASRRALAAKPSASRRWAVPLSIAAVLVLAFGVTLEMQRETPDVTYAPPPAQAPEAKPQLPPDRGLRQAPESRTQSQPAPAMKGESPPASAAKEKLRRAPAAAGELQLPVDKRDFQPAPATRDQKDRAAPEAPARHELAPREEASRPQPAADAFEKSNAAGARPLAAPASPAQTSTPEATTPPPPQGLPAAASPAPKPSGAPLAEPFPQAPESRAKARALDAAPAMRVAPLRADPARELERIAKLREEGRNEEADKALEEFRRANPEFRIPEAMWERVKPR